MIDMIDAKRDCRMTYFLAKTEPSTYSIDQLRQEEQTIWDGVKNQQAVKTISQMRPGDRVFIYHSGGQSAIVGLAKVLEAPHADPKDSKSMVVKLGYLSHLSPPTGLADVKKSKQFEDWALVRQSRLSTMAVPDRFVDWMRERYPDVRF
jgi:predicted RNA-binding protein with PUA-like domain